VSEGGDYMKILMNYFQEMNETLEFFTTAAAGGYVSLVKINKETYGSEGRNPLHFFSLKKISSRLIRGCKQKLPFFLSKLGPPSY
jgi:hypothetical protein